MDVCKRIYTYTYTYILNQFMFAYYINTNLPSTFIKHIRITYLPAIHFFVFVTLQKSHQKS